MDSRQYHAICKQLAEQALESLKETGDYASLNLAGTALLNNWVQVGTAGCSALSTLAGEPVIVKVFVQLERPRNEQAHG